MFRTCPNWLCVVILAGVFCVVGGRCTVVDALVPDGNLGLNRNSRLSYPVSVMEDPTPVPYDFSRQSRLIQLSETRLLLRQRLIYRAEAWLESQPKKRTEANGTGADGTGANGTGANGAGANRAESLVTEFLQDGGSATATATAANAIPRRVETLSPEATAGLSTERLAKVAEFLSGNWDSPDAIESRAAVAVRAVRGPIGESEQSAYAELRSSVAPNSASGLTLDSSPRLAPSSVSGLTLDSLPRLAPSSAPRFASKSRLNLTSGLDFSDSALAAVVAHWDTDTQILIAWRAARRGESDRLPPLPNGPYMVVGCGVTLTSPNRLRDAGWWGGMEPLSANSQRSLSLVEPLHTSGYLLIVQTVLRRE